jgi:NitT/TauT family transport system substrate-binding protein
MHVFIALGWFAQRLRSLFSQISILTCCLILLPAHGEAQDNTIRIETLPVDGAGQILYAQDMGFFKKAGLNVAIHTLNNGAAIAAAVTSHSADIGFSNVFSLGIEYNKNIPVKIIAPAALFVAAAPNAMCLVPRDSPIATATDLNGKVVGISGLKNIAQYGTQAWIDKNGGDSASVHFVEMPFPTIVAGLAQNRIDAGQLTEPFLTEAKKNGRVLSNCFAAIAPKFLISAYFTSNSWIESHPEEARKFEQVMRETAIWANSHQRASATILAKYTQLNPQVINGMVRSQYAERFDSSDVQPEIDLAVRYGAIPKSFPAGNLFYGSPSSN